MKVRTLKEWLIFDAMGVIYEVGDDTRNLLVPYIKRFKPEVEEQKILDLYLDASLGKISSREFWLTFGFEDWKAAQKNYLDSCLVLDGDFISAAERLSKDYNIAMLSNDVSEWSAYLRKRFGLDRLFKEVVISGDAGLRKPDGKIYELLLGRINARPEDCTFFDDRVKNLIPARNIGINTVLFNRDRVDTEGFRSVNGFRELKDIL